MKEGQGSIFVISGPSGSGKTTLLEKLLADNALKKKLVKSISFTTRPKRSRERNKKHYFFVTETEFRQALKAKKILEWTRYLGYYYATPRDFVEQRLRKGKNIVLCLDLNGALKLKRLYPKNTVTIFVLPPSIEALRNRIGARCSKTKQEEIRERLKLAKDELRACRLYDYCLKNKDLAQAIKGLRRIITERIKA